MPQLPPHLSIWVTLFSARLHEAKQCGIGATQCASSSRTTQLHEAVQCGFGLCRALPAIYLLIGPSNIHLVAEVIRFCQTNLLRKKSDCCSAEGKTYQDGIVQICRTIDIQLYNRVASFTHLHFFNGLIYITPVAHKRPSYCQGRQRWRQRSKLSSHNYTVQTLFSQKCKIEKPKLGFHYCRLEDTTNTIVC